MSASIPYNCAFYFDNNLREVPYSVSDMRKAINYVKEQTKSSEQNQDQLGKQYGLIGVYSRIIGNYKDSISYLNSAIIIHSSNSNAKQAWINKLRLAHTYQWMKDFHTSNHMFDTLLEQANTHDHHFGLLDFLYQHYGKNQYDQLNYQSALQWFEKALNIRTKSKEEELIHSSRIAIQACKKQLYKESSERLKPYIFYISNDYVRKKIY